MESKYYAVVFYVFIISFSVNIFLILLSKKSNLFIDGGSVDKPQRFHSTDTPRIGGLGIVLAFLLGSLLLKNRLSLELFASSLPVVIGGLLEDMSISVKPKIRLMLAFVSSIAMVLLSGYVLKTLGFAPFTNLSKWIAIFFTVFAVSGVTNSINIIDGFNGLASGFALISLAVFGVVSYQLHDIVLFNISLSLFLAVFGFFVLNFPFGKIFLGDGGAYFLGFSLAEFSILLVERHPNISPWFCLAVMIYPVWEVVFSMYRRKILRGMPAMSPDKMHFHSVVFRTITHSNTLTTIFILPFILSFDILAYFARYRTSLSMLVVLTFMITYNMTYHALVWKKPPFNKMPSK